MNFRLESFCNNNLAPGTGRVDIVLTATAESGGEAVPQSAEGAVVGIIVDMSGSMQGQREEAARHAVRRAIGLLDEKTQFFVIQFSTTASLIFGPGLATDLNKKIADEAVKRLMAGGATFMSNALKLAKDIYARMPRAIHYALFLTDGRNADDDATALDAVLDQSAGVFQCDCRGVGTDWEPKQLRRIAERLLGTAAIIPTPSEMEADFAAAIKGALSRSVNDVRLRIWTPKIAKIVTCKLVSPRIESLLEHGESVDGQTIDFPTGACSPESRDYYVAIQLPPGEADEEMLACRPSLVYGSGANESRVLGGNVVVGWTLDDQLSARIDDHVAHYTGQQELAEAIEEGLEARQRGDIETATKALGRAAKIANESGNEETTRRLSKVVDIVDVREGTVRLKSSVNRADEMDLDLGSTRTARVTTKKLS